MLENDLKTYQYFLYYIKSRFRGLYYKFVYFYQRNTRGYDDIEIIDLGHQTLKWLSPRLEAFSRNQCGAPAGYPQYPGFNPLETSFDDWDRDIKRASNAIKKHVEIEDGKHYLTVEETKEHEKELDWATEWLGKWILALWI